MIKNAGDEVDVVRQQDQQDPPRRLRRSHQVGGRALAHPCFPSFSASTWARPVFWGRSNGKASNL